MKSAEEIEDVQRELQRVLGAVVVPEINSTVTVLRFRLPHCNAHTALTASESPGNDFHSKDSSTPNTVPALTLADVFETLQNKSFASHIEDFSVSQTTLEQVAGRSMAFAFSANACQLIVVADSYLGLTAVLGMYL